MNSPLIALTILCVLWARKLPDWGNNNSVSWRSKQHKDYKLSHKADYGQTGNAVIVDPAANVVLRNED